jgi:hypothetical protein
MKVSNMKVSNMKAIPVALCALLLVAGAFAQQSHPAVTAHDTAHATQSSQPTDETDGTPSVITGYVRDVACLVQNPKAGAATTPVAKECLEKCVRGGSPLVILSEDGLLYVPISRETPDKSVRSQLLPYAGKYVKASGKLFERGGLHSISIEKIEPITRPPDSKIPTS